MIEFAYSQIRLDLYEKTEDYILETGGNIQIVISLKLNYNKSKVATISTYPLGCGVEYGKEMFSAVQELEGEALATNPVISCYTNA
jgi:hypothetical protein